MTEHLWGRLVKAKQRLEPVQSQYRILWEDPADPDAPAKVTVPDPNLLAAAMAGGVLPPIEAYLEDHDRMAAWCKANPAQPFAWKHVGGAKHPYAAPIGAMSEEEAIEYLIQKDIPPRVWRDYRGNRTILKIVPVHMIPKDRSYRNAWRIKQEEAA